MIGFLKLSERFCEITTRRSLLMLAGEIFASEKTVERVLSSIYSKYGLVGTSKVENPRVRATLIFRGLSK